MDPTAFATAFATSEPLERSELEAAPIRYPRPSVLGAALSFEGAKMQRAADTLGLATVGDLLLHLPRDRREARAVAELVPGDSATVVVQVRSISSRSVRRRGMRPLVEATVADDSGAMKATFFNQPWLEQRYPVGTRLALHGKFEGRRRFRVQAHARTGDAVSGADATVAHYPATEGLTSTQILALVREHRGAFEDVIEPLAAAVLTRERLPERSAALTEAHFAASDAGLELARQRLAFDELLLAQLVLLRRRLRRRSSSTAPVIAGERELTARWLADMLPFALTGDQTRALDAVDRDLAADVPMQRLLMGEVGSGKTVVALYTLLRAVEEGYQGALMAPTETLAEQHFATLQRLMPGALVPFGLLTGSTPGRRRADVLGKLSTGELPLIVGTHALIEDSVRFARLGVVVVDEQHRFGVRQRAALDAKGAEGERPHVLHMTATPIPRTLALAGYGDLDHTLLQELPAGRRPIKTFVCSSASDRERAYDRIREELRAGRQAFVVCPLVDESELLQARAATAEFERLRSGEFRDFDVVLVHGQLRPAAKQEAMAAFASGSADVLVATSVIEVGIDVPNATVMLVEDADRYGISQLHQLRGRIGRGSHDSICLLFGSKDSARLRALASHRDGFRLAEIDLELRGEGELVGTRQHGEAQYRVAELPRDAALLERARRHAEEVVASDPELSEPANALLADALLGTFGAEALAPIRA
ncbi:MAG TPA: ATP-dependent DNA helicase RecG [Solirubrobacteraceae bacterium]|nr:ATP-dependent DNA helicase RecG [Solirubrobacteraceae bacterium]